MPPISDIEVYQTAAAVIKQHGDAAYVHAAMRADELLDQGDIDGRSVWKRVVAAINELLAAHFLVTRQLQ